MDRIIHVGLFGLGNVATGVLQLMKKHQPEIDKRAGTHVRISKIVVADLAKKRNVDLSGITLSNNPDDILNDPDIDIVIELIGGLHPAESIVLKAFEKGKSVITANKALLAEKGADIFPAAHEAAGCFGFESSVGTAIPIIRTLKEGFAGDEILKISGIVNGTSNYILTAMTETGMEFDEALKAAQEKGLAESDPTFDIKGYDAAHKLIIMMNLAFGGIFDYSALYKEGISDIKAVDIEYTKELGYAVKHIAAARKTDKGIEASVKPALIPHNHIFSSVNNAFNSISVIGSFMGPSTLYGLGAGPGPTAVGIAGDLIEACRYILTGQKRPISPLSIPLQCWEPKTLVPMEQIRSAYYLRFNVFDRLGVLSSISGILAKNGISVKSVIQKAGDSGMDQQVNIVLITHEASEADIRSALEEVDGQAYITTKTQLIRIEPVVTA